MFKQWRIPRVTTRPPPLRGRGWHARKRGHLECPRHLDPSGPNPFWGHFYKCDARPLRESSAAATTNLVSAPLKPLNCAQRVRVCRSPWFWLLRARIPRLRVCRHPLAHPFSFFGVRRSARRIVRHTVPTPLDTRSMHGVVMLAMLKVEEASPPATAASLKRQLVAARS